MNPANLNKLSPSDSAVKYVKMMGGSERIITKANNAFTRGEYRWVAELLNHLVFAEPGNRQARLFQADTLE